MDDVFARAWTAARSDWPGIAVPQPLFRAFLEQRTDPAERTPEALGRLALSDLYLVCACIERADGAAAAFEAHCAPALDAAVARIRADHSLGAEVRQLVLELLFVGRSGVGAIDTYTGRGRLRAWVRVIAVREAVRLQRKKRQDVPVEDDAIFDVIAPGEGDDPEVEYLKQHYRAEFKRAFLVAVAELPRRERTALRMNVLDGLSIDQIGATFGVHRSTAARWLSEARDSLVEATRAGLMRELGIGSAEVDSVIRLVRSNLDVSLEQVLSSRS